MRSALLLPVLLCSWALAARDPTLAMLYDFEHSLTADALGQHPGTLTGPQTAAVGITDVGCPTQGKCGFFSNAGPQIVIADSPSLEVGTSGFTMMAWARFSENRVMRVLSHGLNGWTRGYQMAVWPWDGNIPFGAMAAGIGFPGKGAFVVGTCAPMSDDRWHHYALTYNRTDTMARFYVDGVVLQNPCYQIAHLNWGPRGVGDCSLSDSPTLNVDESCQVAIGGVSDCYINHQQDFIGGIDDVAIFHRALEAREVAKICRSGSVLAECTTSSDCTGTANRCDAGVCVVDVPPAFTANSIRATEGEVATVTPAMIDVAGSGNATGLVFRVRSADHCFFALSSSPTIAVGSFTPAQIRAGLVVFVNDGGETTPAYALSVFDGIAEGSAQQGEVTYVLVDDAPVISANSLAVVEGQTLAITSAMIRAEDPDTPADRLVFTVAYPQGSSGFFALASAPAVPVSHVEMPENPCFFGVRTSVGVWDLLREASPAIETLPTFYSATFSVLVSWNETVELAPVADSRRAAPAVVRARQASSVLSFSLAINRVLSASSSIATLDPTLRAAWVSKASARPHTLGAGVDYVLVDLELVTVASQAGYAVDPSSFVVVSVSGVISRVSKPALLTARSEEQRWAMTANITGACSAGLSDVFRLGYALVTQQAQSASLVGSFTLSLGSLEDWCTVGARNGTLSISGSQSTHRTQSELEQTARFFLGDSVHVRDAVLADRHQTTSSIVSVVLSGAALRPGTPAVLYRQGAATPGFSYSEEPCPAGSAADVCFSFSVPQALFVDNAELTINTTLLVALNGHTLRADTPAQRHVSTVSRTGLAIGIRKCISVIVGVEHTKRASEGEARRGWGVLAMDNQIDGMLSTPHAVLEP
eukprot:m51a1_g11428 hypothetical protein (875) ;mRNA; r:10927-15823